MKSISMSDMEAHVKSPRPGEIILDVRTPEEYSAGHVPGSLNIPYDQVQFHMDEIKKHTHIYIYCHAGVRAYHAAATLEGLGVTNVSCVDEEGFPQWKMN